MSRRGKKSIVEPHIVQRMRCQESRIRVTESHSLTAKPRQFSQGDYNGHRLAAPRQLNLLTGYPSLVIRPSSTIGHAIHEPLHDRVESLLIERVPAMDTQLRNEVAGDLGHDLVGIP